MKQFYVGVAITVALFVALFVLPRPTEARPTYTKVFAETYPHLPVKKHKCVLCHAPRLAPVDHPIRIYYRALKKEIGGKDLNPIELREAIKAVEDALPYPPKPRQRGTL
jgi:hypothetical protein